MKLINFEIGNFKAFGTTQTIEFGLPNEKALGSGLTIIVGPNNSGKSTILKSIRSLASHEEELIAGIDDRRGQEPVWLRLVARDKDRNFEVAVEQHSQGAYLKKTNPFDTGWGLNLRSIPARRPWQDRFVAQQGMGSFNYENSLNG
jgi:energy-coupling factor transporter ATP-binding protein EcfA2